MYLDIYFLSEVSLKIDPSKSIVRIKDHFMRNVCVHVEISDFSLQTLVFENLSTV